MKWRVVCVLRPPACRTTSSPNECEINRIIFLPEVKKKMRTSRSSRQGEPGELGTLARTDADKWGRIIKDLGIAVQ